ncbi:MAG: segregation/condensation protein A [Eubacteriales bacterium]|nr:segregation/condensation protein A [Clostridiales bacterium]MDY5836963.1 segregation/condensation protein A [Eubacteriales bacterium]
MSEFHYDIREYASPLALLDHIIRDKKADLFDLPIAEIAAQYLAVIEDDSQADLDMDLASEFVVMASTLMQIKTSLLLPKRPLAETEAGPMDELVLQLMAYRRMKVLAEDLEDLYAQYGGTVQREALLPSQLGLEVEMVEDPLQADQVWAAADRLAAINAQRYNQQNLRIKRLLKPQRFTIKDAVRRLFKEFRHKSSVFFHDLFPAQGGQDERVSGFLAVLELVNSNRLEAKQDKVFGPITLVRNRQEKDIDE